MFSPAWEQVHPLPGAHSALPAWNCPCPACCCLLLQVQRYVVQSRLQAATQGTFSDLSLRRFVVRCVCVLAGLHGYPADCLAGRRVYAGLH